MKTSLILLSLLLCAGCQSASRPTPPEPVTPVAKAPPVASPPTVAPTGAEHKLTQQSRLMAALIEQNDVLAEKLRATERPPAPAAIPPPVTTVPNVSLPLAAAVSPAEDPKPGLPLHTPNADGLIDLSIPAGAPGASVNPFALRAVATEPRREITLLVQGIAAGPNACALINERMCAPGDTVESLRLDRIEPEAVILRGESFRLRIPPTDKPVRVRLPL
jgi:hypothetical protein